MTKCSPVSSHQSFVSRNLLPVFHLGQKSGSWMHYTEKEEKLGKGKQKKLAI
jgi:hypothetical protein